jgi:hypothetical protein
MSKRVTLVEFDAVTSYLDKKLEASEKKIMQAQERLQKSNAFLTDSFKKMAGALGLAFGAQQIMNFTKEAITAAAKMEGVRLAFDRLNKPDLLNNLRKATRGTVTDLVLMTNAVKANNFQIALEQLPTLFEFARRRAKDTGEDVQFLVDSIILGIGRKSPLILDNLGISAIRLREKLKGVGTEAANIGAVTKAVSEIIEEEMAKMGDDVETSAEKMQRVQTTFDNLKTQIGEGLIPTIDELVGSLNKIDGTGNGLAKIIDAWATVISWIPRNITLPVINAAADLFREAKQIPAMNTYNQPQISMMSTYANRPPEVWTAVDKTIGQIQDRIKELKEQQKDLTPGSESLLKNVKEIDRLEELINTKQDKRKAKLRDLGAAYERIIALMKNPELAKYGTYDKNGKLINAGMQKLDQKIDFKKYWTDEQKDVKQPWLENIEAENDEFLSGVQNTTDTVASAFESMFSVIEVRAAENASALERGFVNMANVFLQELQRMAAGWVAKQVVFSALNWLMPGTGTAVAAAGAFHKGGTVTNLNGVPKFASGGSFTVPPGFPNDSFPILVESGERVTVTPKGGSSDKYLQQLLSRIDVLNSNIIEQYLHSRKSGDIRIFGTLDGSDIYLSNKRASKFIGRMS